MLSSPSPKRQSTLELTIIEDEAADTKGDSFVAKSSQRCPRDWRYCSRHFHHISTVALLIIHFLTDIILLYSYYNIGSAVYFWTSLVIMAFALLGFAIAVRACPKSNRLNYCVVSAFIESLLQSILQFAATIHLRETDSILAVLFILSMIKILILFQLIHQKSYFLSICVFTDFFSIFFIVSWLLLSNEHINGDFLGMFSIIGEVWCWKVMIAIVCPCFLCFLFGIWIASCIGIYEVYDDDDGCGWEWALLILCLVCCVPAMVPLSVIIAIIVSLPFLCLEIPCFSYLPICFETAGRWERNGQELTNILKVILDFIGYASNDDNDRILRILAVNRVYSPENKLAKYIEEQKKKETLQDITYSDLRMNCDTPENANVTSAVSAYLSFFLRAADELECFRVIGQIIAVLYGLSRILTVLYPYWIALYLSYNGLWRKMQSFELVMLGTYIGLQCIIPIVGIPVFRIQRWLWHIAPGNLYVNWPHNFNHTVKGIYENYAAFMSIPLMRRLVANRVGADIAMLVMDYVNAIDDSLPDDIPNIAENVFNDLDAFALANKLKRKIVKLVARGLSRRQWTKYQTDFVKLDVKGNGVLDWRDFAVAIEQWHSSRPMEHIGHVARRTVEGITGNGYGAITQDDWIHSNVAKKISSDDRILRRYFQS